MRSKTRVNIFISLLDHAYEAPFANMKMARNTLYNKEVWNQYVAMVTELFKFKL